MKERDKTGGHRVTVWEKRAERGVVGKNTDDAGLVVGITKMAVPIADQQGAGKLRVQLLRDPKHAFFIRCVRRLPPQDGGCIFQAGHHAVELVEKIFIAFDAVGLVQTNSVGE